MAFFRQPDITSIISSHYQRGVRPQLRDIIGGIRMEGTTALERIQTSASEVLQHMSWPLCSGEITITKYRSTVYM